MPNSQLELAMYYADLGRPYLPLIERACASAKAVMPDCKLTLLTPTPSKQLARHFDESVWIKSDVTPANICFERARAMMTWQQRSENPIVFIDPDLEFKNPIIFPDDADVGLIWTKKSAHPVNTGIVLAKPGCPEFWTHYGKICASLPKALRAWWCDQLAFSVLLGTLHKAGDTVQADDARVKLIAAEDACAPPEKATEATWSLHYKGVRKGPGWEPYFSQPEKSADGKSLRACA